MNDQQNRKRKLTPKLRFPEFRDAGEWEEKPLGDFLAESRIPGSKGNVAKKITVKLWGNGVFAKNETVQGSVNTQYFRRKAGQFIYSKLDFLNQAFGIIPVNLDNYESIVDLPCFDFLEGLNPQFLLEYVKRKEFYERHGEAADGSRKAKRIQVEAFFSFSILLSALAEQQKIADCLSSIDELITAQAQKLDTFKAHKKGLMQQLFPAEGETLPKLRFPEFRDAGEWEKDELRKISLFVNERMPLDQLSLTNYVSTENILPDYEGLVVASKLPSSGTVTRFKANDVLISNIRPYLKKVFLAKKNGGASNDVIVVRAKSKVIYQYLSFMLRNDAFIEYVMRGAKGVKMPRGDISLMKEYPLAYPFDKAEQQKIADCLSSLDELITAQAQKLATLKTHKKGLMQQLFPALDEGQG